VTIGLGEGTFLFVVNDDHASIFHRYGDMEPQRYWGHDLDLLGSRDVIDHLTIGLGVGTFLMVVNDDDHVPILHIFSSDLFFFPISSLCARVCFQYKVWKIFSHNK